MIAAPKVHAWPVEQKGSQGQQNKVKEARMASGTKRLTRPVEQRGSQGQWNKIKEARMASETKRLT